MNDAINADTDRAVERLKDDLKSQEHQLRRDHQAESAAEPGIDRDQGRSAGVVSDLRSLVTDRLPDYDLASGPENSLTLQLKPSRVKDIKTKA